MARKQLQLAKETAHNLGYPNIKMALKAYDTPVHRYRQLIDEGVDPETAMTWGRKPRYDVTKFSKFGIHVLRFAEQKGFRMKDLAQEAGITYPTLSRYLKAKNLTVNPKKLTQIANALGIDYDTLIEPLFNKETQ